MIVAQVITLFLPEFVGGATLVCAEAARGLRGRGHTVEVFCGTPTADAAAHGTHTWEVDGIPVTAVDAASGYVILDTRSYRHPEITPHFERFLDRVRPDVVHLHSIQALGTTVIDAAVARRIPVVLTMHDWWWACARLFLVDAEGFVCAPRVDSARCHCAPGFDLVARRRELARALELVTRVLTPSRVLADSAIANGVDPARVEVCPNGIVGTVADASVAGVTAAGVPTAGAGNVALPPVRRRRPGPVRFGYVGGPDNRAKGLPTLLAAADRLEVGGWTLSLFGVAPGAAWVPFAIFDRVHHLPRFTPAKRAETLAELDVLVVPSLMRESYSLITREALAAGVPVIASDSGGPQEILRDGVNGFTVATAEPAALASAMARILRDPALRERLAASAAATQLPTHAGHLDQLERVYREVVDESSAVRSTADVPAAPRHEGALPARGDLRRASALPSLRRVLFVSGIDSAPFRYRVTHLREQLRARGIASAALYYTDPVIPAAIELADLIIAYRVPMSPWVAHWLACARAARRPVAFSCDDLVFDPDSAPADALALLPDGQRAGWLAHTRRYRETLAACDAFIGTTDPLVAAAARAGVSGTVIRNGLGAAELRVAETARHASWSNRRDGVRIVYASGTIMHDLDFATIEPALAAVLEDHPEVRLVLIGYLRTGPALAPYATRIERVPFAPWPQLMRLLADADVNVAPLSSDAFSDAKSEVKYLEAGAVGVPTVASPTWAFRRAIRPGSNGLLAATHEEWVTALGSLIEDPGLRRRLGNAARDDVFLRAGPEAHADGLVAALTAIRDTHRENRLASRQEDAPDLVEPTGLDQIGRYDLEPADARPGTAQPAYDDYSPVFANGRTVGQTFTPEAEGLYRIDVRVAADETGMLPAMVVHLAADATDRNPILRHAVISAGRVAPDAWIAAEFDPLEGGPPRSLYVWVELADPNAPAERAIMLRTYQQGWGEGPPTGLHLDHRPAPGSLTFRTFSRDRGATTTRSNRSDG